MGADDVAEPEGEIRRHLHPHARHHPRCQRHPPRRSMHVLRGVGPSDSLLPSARLSHTPCIHHHLGIRLGLGSVGTWTPGGLCWNRCSKWQMGAHRPYAAGGTGIVCAQCCHTGNISPLCPCPGHPHQWHEGSLSQRVRAHDTQNTECCFCALLHVSCVETQIVGRGLVVSCVNIPRLDFGPRSWRSRPFRLPSRPRAPLADGICRSTSLACAKNLSRLASDLAFLALSRKSLARFRRAFGSGMS